ncbi:mitochondrial import receptor subunit or translocase [Hirsutella rhossiliensis]|uniref:Mitochondrial import receptor subunit or translocase n=1 Tax=Hirsutella rhossiliensis TaxID=111463 RepID=A0A9P8SI60_9HYPO|nr:mitochondrial import receptor subunit or translocase [Hirsutella rhossiliensis]KAH0963858.1 mitochondrial import receptor subunit or translocase [Hirsutella rhossiliensis]
MFAGFAPPQQSPEEIRAMEAEAAFTVQQVAATAFMLYLCRSSVASFVCDPY